MTLAYLYQAGCSSCRQRMGAREHEQVRVLVGRKSMNNVFYIVGVVVVVLVVLGYLGFR
jgi:hypothetical protein